MLTAVAEGEEKVGDKGGDGGEAEASLRAVGLKLSSCQPAGSAHMYNCSLSEVVGVMSVLQSIMLPSFEVHTRNTLRPGGTAHVFIVFGKQRFSSLTKDDAHQKQVCNLPHCYCYG